MRRRSYEIDRGQLHCQPLREMARLICHGNLPGSWTRNENSPISIDGISRKLDDKVARHLERLQPKAAYFYEDTAVKSLEACQRLGIPSFYELPIAYGPHAREILEVEKERYPEWIPTLTGLHDSEKKMDQKRRELELADHIIVPSPFVAQSLPPELATARKSVFINPYGTEAPRAFATKARNPHAPLRVLFVGALSQRKGLADLFAACRHLRKGQIELHLLGRPILPLSFYRQQCPVEFVYHLPCTRSSVLDLMAQSDVLVLPSLIEGRALVQLEALSQGLPLIITPHTGGDDLVTDGLNGFTVPIRSPESIAEKLNLLADNHELLAAMKKQARERALAITWKQYRHRLTDYIRKITLLT